MMTVHVLIAKGSLFAGNGVIERKVIEVDVFGAGGAFCCVAEIIGGGVVGFCKLL